MSRRNRNLLLAALGAAAGIALVLILVSVLSSGDDEKAATTTRAVVTLPVEPDNGIGTTKVPGAAEAAALFAGVPQRLNELGRHDAPVMMIEFADLQCPFCRQYAVAALPAIVKDYVKPGKVKLVFSGMAFLGPDSEKALRAVYAAGLQGKLWNYLDLLYRNQGPEKSGWVTDDLLRSVGNSIPGFDTGKLMADRNSSAVDGALAAAQGQADSAHVDQTPTFFAGPTGQTLQHVTVGALTADAFRPTLDALTK